MDSSDKQTSENEGKLKKFQFVSTWVCSNVLYGAILSALVDNPSVKGYFIIFLAILGAYLMTLRGFGSICYYISYFFKNN